MEAASELVRAAIQGVEVINMEPKENPARVTDTEPEAALEVLAERVEKRMKRPSVLQSESLGEFGSNADEVRRCSPA